MSPKRISEDQYRTRFFEDLVVGESFESRWEQLSEPEMLRFSREFDRQYVHTDVTAAADSPFGGLIASGAHTFAVWNRINLEVNGDIAWIAGLGFNDFRFPNPLRPDTDFKATSTLVERRESSQPTRGLVVHEYRLVTADGSVVFSCSCPALVHRRA